MNLPSELSCFILDDDPHAISILRNYIERTPGLSVAGITSDPLAILYGVFDGTYPDVIFVDMTFPTAGAEVIRRLATTSRIVCCSASKLFAIDAFDLHAVDFLLKPFSYDRFMSAVSRLMRERTTKPPSDEDVFIRPGTKGTLMRLTYSDIVYVQGLSNYVNIYTKVEKLTTYLTLKEIFTHLGSRGFLRIHKSYIVNLTAIKRIDSKRLVLNDLSTELPIGVGYKQSFLSAISKLELRSSRL